MPSDESMVWTGRPSQFTNLGTYILCALVSLTVFLAPIAAIVALWKYFTVRMQTYELTNQRLRVQSGVLTRKHDEIELYRVKDTRFEQSFMQRLFGIGNVVLLSSDVSQPSQVIKAIPNAQALREQLRTLVEERRDAKRVRVIERE